jgi:hypothetical protein
MDKITALKLAIENADQLKSELPGEQYQVPALTSLRIRHLLNSIGKLGTKYMEIGVHKGGTFTASVSNNSNLTEIVAIDSFASDENDYEKTVNEYGKARPEFEHWANKFLPKESSFKLIVSDSFQVDLNEVPKDIDVYLYDGDHSEEYQRKALTYFKDNLADEFIFLCDDFGWGDVQKGTRKGIEDAGYIILFEQYMASKNSHDNDSWWNGFYVALLKKGENKIEWQKRMKQPMMEKGKRKNQKANNGKLQKRCR